MIVNIPMQPIDSSYSKQWHEWIQQELIDRKLKHITILPFGLVDDQGKGYTDIVSVAHFRAAQFQKICEAIQDRTIPQDDRVVFFFHNAWFPIEQLAMLRDMLGAHDWKFVGCFRDGTYDKWDLSARTNQYVWGKDIENGWLKIYDRIIVGSQYHADVLMEERIVRQSKIDVIPWHVEVPVIYGVKKENIVVFPHRLDPEKQPEVFDRLIKDFRDSGWKFIRTRDKNLSKSDYYRFLASCKVVVSTALLEMFGNAMIEATLLGCIPLVPDRLAYRELFNEAYRYNSYDDLKFKLNMVMCPDINSTRYLQNEYIRYLSERMFFNNLFCILETV